MAIIGPSPYTGEKANDLGLNESVTFDDWNPTEEIKFVMANGQFHAAPDKDYEELARNAGAGPTYQGPMVMGTIHLDHGKAQFDNISTNLHAQGVNNLLQDWSKTQGWQWGGASSDGLNLSPSSVTSMYFQADGGHLSFAKSAKSLERVTGAIHIKGHKVYPYPLNPNYYQAIREWADDHSMIIMAGDNVIKTVEDLEQHDLYSPEWNNPEDHFMGRDPKQDDKTPQGPQRCQYCKEWFPSFNSLIEHQKNDEEPWDDINEQDRNKMQSPPDMDDPIPWKFLETPKYYGAASVQAVPFIYDIKNDDIEVGQPGVTVDTLNSVRFTPGGVMRGIFDNGKLILQSGSDYQVSVAHLLQLWAYKMPHLYIKSVWLEDQSGKPTKLASEGAK